MNQQPSHNSLWFLFARSLSGEITAQEQSILKTILDQDIALQQQFDLMNRMWNAGEKNYVDTDDEEKNSISHILQLVKMDVVQEEELPAIGTEKRKSWLPGILKVAAIVILVVSSWMFFGSSKKAGEDLTKTLSAENGSRTRTILPDGSTVWVNAGSHISFDNDFKGQTREVTLNGEAYFDVVKNPQQPFIVHVSGYDIRVLGTAFNVKSYPDDKTIETTLLRGLVQVTKQGETKQRPIFLHPNEKLILDKNPVVESVDKQPEPVAHSASPANTEYKITQLDSGIEESARIETAWVYNRLEFRGDSFDDLAAKLERWYNVNIFFDDDKVKQLSFNGSFQQETIDQALTALKTAAAFDFAITGKDIHISSAH